MARRHAVRFAVQDTLSVPEPFAFDVAVVDGVERTPLVRAVQVVATRKAAAKAPKTIEVSHDQFVDRLRPTPFLFGNVFRNCLARRVCHQATPSSASRSDGCSASISARLSSLAASGFTRSASAISSHAVAYAPSDMSE